MSKDIFRKRPEDQIASIEALDRMMRLTSPLGWAAILATGLMLTVGLVWGLYGDINYNTNGWGMIIKRSGISMIQAPAAGKLCSLNVRVGDFVSIGQTVGRIEQSEIANKIKAKRDRVKELEQQFAEIKALDKTDLENKLEYLDKQEQNTKQNISDLSNHIEWLKKMLASYEKLAEGGAMSKVDYHKNKRDYEEHRIKLNDAQNNLINIVYQRLQYKSSLAKEHLIKQLQINDEKKELKMLTEQLRDNELITSKYSGYVQELFVNVGEIVQTQDPVISLAEGKERMIEAKVFFSPINGKKIKPGMIAKVTPTTIKKEKFGAIEGIVTSVSPYPSSDKTIMTELQNKNLVNQITADGPPLKVIIKLMLDADTHSGFKWTSSKGPPIQINSGTICIASVTTRREAPINLLIQMTRKYLLGVGIDEGKIENAINKDN